ncbi:hypothetical protein BC567DRAFT_29244 [Phyllosticta citribraziliensis]
MEGEKPRLAHLNFRSAAHACAHAHPSSSCLFVASPLRCCRRRRCWSLEFPCLFQNFFDVFSFALLSGRRHVRIPFRNQRVCNFFPSFASRELMGIPCQETQSCTARPSTHKVPARPTTIGQPNESRMPSDWSRKAMQRAGKSSPQPPHP